jgi:hypothetical protein
LLRQIERTGERMSKRINVNPGNYKVAGRERQGEDIVQSLERRTFAQQQAQTDRWRERQQAPPWETTPSSDVAEPEVKGTPAPAPAPAPRRKAAPRAKALNERRTARPKARKRTKAATRKPAPAASARSGRGASKASSRSRAASKAPRGRQAASRARGAATKRKGRK